MSFAMDDLGRSYGIDTAIQTKLVEETRKVDKSADINSTDATLAEPVVNDVFESSQLKPDPLKTSIEGIQEESTVIDIKKEALNKIGSSVKDIKTTIEEGKTQDVSSQKIAENYDKISQIAKETSFNDKKLIKTPDDTTEKSTDSKTEQISLNEMNLSDIKHLETNTTKQKEESVKKLDEMLNNIKEKEQELNSKQEDITQKIHQNSLVELKLSSTAETEKQELVAEKLKESTVQNIKETPEKSIKMHVKNIDKNLLLAMLSLRMA